MGKRQKYSLISIVYSLSPGHNQAARLTKADPTQPPGSANGNIQKYSLDPIIYRFRSPARMVGLKSECDDNYYFDWSEGYWLAAGVPPSFCRN